MQLFTERARDIMQFANAIAQEHHHEYLGTEHILFALLERNENSVAFLVLEKLDVIESVAAELNRHVQNGPEEISVTGKLPLTPRARKVIELARKWGRKGPIVEVGTEDLLLGLIEELEGVAAQVLMKMDITINAVQNKLKELGLRLQKKSPELEGDADFRRAMDELKLDIGTPDMSDVEAIRRGGYAIRLLRELHQKTPHILENLS